MLEAFFILLGLFGVGLLVYAAIDSARYHTPEAERRAETYWADFRVDCMIERDRDYRRKRFIESAAEDYYGPY